MAAFAEFLQGNDHAAGIVRKEALKEPWVDTLIVDTKPGWPSHAEVLARWFWVTRQERLPPVVSVQMPAEVPAPLPAG